MRAHFRRILFVSIALCLAACGSAPGRAPDEPFDATGDFERAAGVSCSGASVCPSSEDVYSSVYRIGASTTARFELLQFFTATPGTPAHLRLRLRRLRAFTNASVRVHAELLELTSADGAIDDAVLGAVQVVAAASVAATAVGAGDTTFDFPAGTTGALAARDYALRVYTDDVGAADGPLVLGVGALRTFHYAPGAQRRGLRPLETAPFRTAGSLDVAFGLVFEGDATLGLEGNPGASCHAILDGGGSIGDGVYWLDTGSGAGPFRAWCDMTIDGGGWTLVTSTSGGTPSEPAIIVDVDTSTLVTPDSLDVTNRNLQLPDASEILIVNDGKDAGFETAFDKQEKITGVTGFVFTWQEVLDSLNRAAGHTWEDGSYCTGGCQDGWTFAATRVNTTGCLQTALRSAYGNGNYGAFNMPNVGNGGAGLLYWHWGAETWLAGANTYSDLRCDSVAHDFTSYWKGLYLR